MIRATLDPATAFGRHPLQPHQLTDRITPTEHTIVLCHLGVPRINADDWSLTIDGLVRKSVHVALGELLRRPRVEITGIHQCCGSPLKPDMPTRRVCNVVWGGTRLSELLAECEPLPSARFLWSSGADYGVFEGITCEAFVKDLPLGRTAADVLIAYEMNGAPLRPENGYPVRLVVPGFYGTNSVKWLTRLTLAQARAAGPFTTRWYNDPARDSSGQPTGASTPVWSIAPESVIVSPAPNETVGVGNVEVWGWAWPDGGVGAVDINADGVSNWIPASVEPSVGRAWQRFTATVQVEARGSYEVCSRAQAPMDANSRNLARATRFIVFQSLLYEFLCRRLASVGHFAAHPHVRCKSQCLAWAKSGRRLRSSERPRFATIDRDRCTRGVRRHAHPRHSCRFESESMTSIPMHRLCSFVAG